MSIIENFITFYGTYDGRPLEVESTRSRVMIITGLSATKVADKTVWVDGLLTYTVTLTNNSGNAFVTPQFVDEIDTTLSTLVDGSVLVNGVAALYSFEYGVLKIDLDTIEDGGTVEVIFSVSRV